jgi:hypothetical protein
MPAQFKSGIFSIPERNAEAMMLFFNRQSLEIIYNRYCYYITRRSD